MCDAVCVEGNYLSEFDPGMISAAVRLATCEPDALTAAQHAALLRWLCDGVLESEGVRDALTQRMEHSQDMLQAKRGELAEERAKLK